MTTLQVFIYINIYSGFKSILYVNCIVLSKSLKMWVIYLNMILHSADSYLCDPMDCSPPGCSVPEDSPGENTGMGCHALLQGIFPTQGSSPGLLHCRQILYQLSYESKPLSGKEPACQCRRWKRFGLDPWVRKIPWRRAWQPTPVFWRILWTEEAGRLQSIGLHRVRHNWRDLAHNVNPLYFN